MKELKEITLDLAAALDPSTSRNKWIPLDSLMIERAVREGVAGILYRSLIASGRFESLERRHRETLQAFYYQTLWKNLRFMHALKRVLFHSNQRGVAVLVLQGIDLLNEPYEDIGLRPMTDIDLWVPKKDYEKIVQVLETLGYEPDAVYPSNFKQGSVLFDVHTHILWADRIRARKLLLGKSEEHLIKQVRAIEIEGEKALCLSPCDKVLYLSLHAFKHRVDRLIWLMDIKRILERWSAADRERLVHRAQDLGQERTLRYILFLLDQIFRVRTPPDAFKPVYRKALGLLERKILRERMTKGALPIWGPVLLFSSQLGLGKRLTFIFETLFPRTDILRQVFPYPSSLKPWQLYGRRSLQLLGMFLKALKGS
jgi:hypothetical protein